MYAQDYFVNVPQDFAVVKIRSPQSNTRSLDAESQETRSYQAVHGDLRGTTQ